MKENYHIPKELRGFIIDELDKTIERERRFELWIMREFETKKGKENA